MKINSAGHERNPITAGFALWNATFAAELKTAKIRTIDSDIMLRLYTVIAFIFISSCSPPPAELGDVSPDDAPLAAAIPTAPSPESAPPEIEYPGKTIDQVFPIISEHYFGEKEFKGRHFEVDVFDHRVSIFNFAPISLKSNSKTVLKFTTRSPPDYWSNLVGISNLLGAGSKEIYVVSTGPGAVCCTNYWIVDVRSKKPQVIFRSEDFGNFRGPIEIFDYDGDGIYELVQYDSCFRYFMGDCGSCSPEPRAYFKYDRRSRTYLPAAGIAEKFVLESEVELERSVRAGVAALTDPTDLVARYDIDATVLSHFVNLIHRGEEKRAWAFFRKYHSRPSRAMLSEIKYDLAHCQYYRELPKRGRASN